MELHVEDCKRSLSLLENTAVQFFPETMEAQQLEVRHRIQFMWTTGSGLNLKLEDFDSCFTRHLAILQYFQSNPMNMVQGAGCRVHFAGCRVQGV
jgi:hypothetical protein